MSCFKACSRSRVPPRRLVGSHGRCRAVAMPHRCLACQDMQSCVVARAWGLVIFLHKFRGLIGLSLIGLSYSSITDVDFNICGFSEHFVHRRFRLISFSWNWGILILVISIVTPNSGLSLNGLTAYILGFEYFINWELSSSESLSVILFSTGF